MEFYTTSQPCNAANLEYKGIVMANKTMSKNFVADCGTACRSCIGGEVKNLSRMTQKMREELLGELEAKAKALGANAITGINMETNTVFQGTLDIVCFGTAVKITRE